MAHTDITNELAFDLFAQWEDEKAAGSGVSLEEICAPHPEVLPDVQKIARRLATVAPLFSPPPGDARPPSESDDINGCWPPSWSKVGCGASSIVFKGEDPTFGTVVAFKVLDTQDRVLSSADLVRLMRRFELEARILARLKHDGIVRIFKTFDLGGRQVLEMEYLPGGSLEKNPEAVRAQGAAGIARFMERVARAVGFAHAHNIVHRDLKPSNILLDADGRPCVSDFGVAKLIQFGDRGLSAVDPGGETDQGVGGLTAHDRQPGTKAYMAPEQFDSSFGGITLATDVWALGVIIYELLHGTRPFSGGNAHEWKVAVCHGPLPRPRWAAWRREGRLEAIALRCLSRNPAKRYANAAAVADALAAITRPVWRSLARAVAVVAVVSAFAVAVLARPTPNPAPQLPQEASSRAVVEQDARAAFQLCLEGKVSKGLFAFAGLLERVPADAPELRTAIRANIAAWAGSLATIDGLYTHSDPILAVAASRDGRWIAVGDKRGEVVIWDAHENRVHKRLTGHSEEVLSAAFSHDGRHLVTGSHDLTARVWSVDGPDDTPTTILSVDAWVYAVAFTPDGEHVVTGTGYGVAPADRLAGVNFWNLKTRSRVQFPDTKRSVRAFVTDASGDNLLALLHADNEADVWDLKQRRPRGTLTAGGKPVLVRTAAYSPDGKTLATGGDSLLFWDAETLALKTEERREETDVFGFAPDGAVAVRSGGELRLWQPSASCFDRLPTPRPTAPEIKAVVGKHLIGVEAGQTVVRMGWPGHPVRSLPIPREDVVMSAVGSGNGLYAAVTTAPDAARKGGIENRPACIRLWDMGTLRSVGPPIHAANTCPTVAEFDASGRQVAFQPGVNLSQPSAERPVRVFDVASGRLHGELFGHRSEVNAAKFLKSRLAWVTGGEDQVVRVWTADGKPPRSVRLPGSVFSVSVSGDERALAVGCTDGHVAYLDLSPEAIETKWVLQSGVRVDQVTLSPDGATVVALGRDRRLRAWAATDGTPVSTLDAAPDLTAAFPQLDSPGWVTIHLNGVVRWWPALTANKPNREWLASEGSRYVGLDPTGKVLIAAAADQAQAWAIDTRLPVGPPVRHHQAVSQAVWGNGSVLSLSPKSARAWTPIADADLPDEDHLVSWLTTLTGMTPDSPLTDAKWRDGQFPATKFRQAK